MVSSLFEVPTFRISATNSDKEVTIDLGRAPLSLRFENGCPTGVFSAEIDGVGINGASIDGTRVTLRLGPEDPAITPYSTVTNLRLLFDTEPVPPMLLAERVSR